MYIITLRHIVNWEKEVFHIKTFKDLEIAILYNGDTAMKILLNEIWVSKLTRAHPFLDVYGDPALLTMEFMGVPIEFNEKVKDFMIKY